MSENQNLRYEKKTVYELAGATVVEEAYKYAKNYVKFLDACVSCGNAGAKSAAHGTEVSRQRKLTDKASA